MIKYVVRNTKFQDVKTKSKLKNQHLSLDLWMNFGYGGFERLAPRVLLGYSNLSGLK
jgi:hypothetical protein